MKDFEINRVLQAKNIDIEYIGMSTMNEYDTQVMRYYVLTINNYCFEYYEGVGLEELNELNRREKIISSVVCLINDYQYYQDFKFRTLDDFMSEFGYTDDEKAQKVFDIMGYNSQKLQKVFTAEELDYLLEQTADYWFIDFRLG